MIDTLRRIFFGSKPLDIIMLVVELIVLLLIAYEVSVGIKARHKEARRKKVVDSRISSIRESISQGQKLVNSVPPQGDWQVASWAKSVASWTTKTAELLRQYSPNTEACFLDDVRILRDLVGNEGAQAEYLQLKARLANLRAIIENSNIYL